jgi:hypothetical protein
MQRFIENFGDEKFHKFFHRNVRNIEGRELTNYLHFFY